MPYSTAIRPPLLTEWESERVARFRNPGRRAAWLASRALAKALVREHIGMTGIVEIREGADGQPLVFSGGMPEPDVWLGMSCRAGRVAAVVARRPVSIEIRRSDGSDLALGPQLMQRTELRSLRRIIGSTPAAAAAVRAIKEATLHALRADGGSMTLASVRVEPDLSVCVGGSRLDVLAVRVLDESVIAVVGRTAPDQRPVTKIVLDAELSDSTETPRLQAALERSLARARRIADGRERWQRRLGWSS